MIILLLLLFYFLVVWVLDYAQFRMTSANYGQLYNGCGMIDLVLEGNALAPMQYRVFYPFLFGLLRRFFGVKNHNAKRELNILFIYEPMKIFFMWAALVSFHFYLSVLGFDLLSCLLGSVLVGLFWIITFMYDYLSCYVEMFLWALFMIFVINGNLIGAMVMAGIATLNRETSIFLSLLYFLITLSIVKSLLVGVSIGVVFGLLLFRYGIRKNYVSSLSKNVFNLNIDDIKEFFSTKIIAEKSFCIFYFNETFLFLLYVLLVGTVFCLSLNCLPDTILRLWAFIPVYIAVIFWRARIRELRVLMPTAFVLIPSILYVLL